MLYNIIDYTRHYMATIMTLDHHSYIWKYDNAPVDKSCVEARVVEGHKLET